MLIREEKTDAAAHFGKGFFSGISDPVFFDIETTGLGWRSSHIYLIGVLFSDGCGWTLRQYFLDRPFAEKELLITFSGFLKDRNNCTLVHFNGDTFDIPYLKAKYAFYGLPTPGALSGGSLDLLKICRPLKGMLGLSSLKQTAVERFLGIKRDDRYTGGELIDVYRQFLQTASPDLLNVLYLHNHDDVLALPDLMSMNAYLFPEDDRFLMKDMQLENGRAVFRLAVPLPFPRECRIRRDLFSADLCEKEILLSVKTCSGVLKHFFPGYRDYYYLPAEDQALHKSVAVFTDPAYRIRATAATCYQKTEGVFLPQFGSIREPAFYESYHASPAWLRITGDFLSDPKAQLQYCCSLFRDPLFRK